MRVCECECVREGRACLPVREEVWVKISHSVGFCQMQSEGCFRHSSMCWVEGTRTESHLFLGAGGSGGEVDGCLCQSCPAGEQGDPWAIHCGLHTHTRSWHESPQFEIWSRSAGGWPMSSCSPPVRSWGVEWLTATFPDSLGSLYPGLRAAGA